MSSTMTEQAKKHILIVEDEGDLCLLLDLILSDSKTKTNHARNLQTAKQILETENPDLIVLDNRLPDGLGIDFLKFLKENYPSLRIIMISGKDGSAKDIAIENGADIFLAKPVSKEKLKNAVEDLLF